MTANVPVLSCGPLANIDGFRAVVHAVFPNSLYLEPRHGPLMVIHDVAHGHTPTSLLVPDARALKRNVRRGDPVAGRAGYLRINDVLFDARHAPRWHPPPPPFPTPSCPSPLWRSRLWRSGSVPGPVVDAEARVGADCRRLVTLLMTAQTAGVPETLLSMIGAGPGLTPSGDDAVVAVLAVLHRARRIRPLAIPLGMLTRHLPALLHRTTPISAHYLSLAQQGHFGEHLTQLVDAALTNEPEDLHGSLIDRVLRTGATSGADVLAALAIALSIIEGLSVADIAARDIRGAA
ncbi:MAG: DUF2877 domain-containing protein [Acidimicrobiales bacterium]